MTTHLVTFATDDMSHAAALCVSSAMAHGVDTYHRWIADAVKSWAVPMANRQLFDQPRGCGYWAWKPLVIQVAMNQAQPNDVIVYADAGIEFIDSVNYIIDRMDQDIFLFGNSWEHAHWCKRDIVDEIWPTTTHPLLPDVERPVSWGSFGKQVQASAIFFRVNDTTRAVVKEWLDWCLFEGGRLVDDSPSRAPNHPEFQENRHDQAILTTMAYRDGYKLHWWPAAYNDGAFTYEKGVYTDDYPAIFHHHRRRNHEWEQVA